MKTIPVSFVLLIVTSIWLSFSGFAKSQVEEVGPPPPGPPPSELPPQIKGERDRKGRAQAAAQFWKSVDKDQDGFLSPEEFDGLPRVKKVPEAKRAEIFKRLDKNADGRLARVELGRMAGKPHAGQGPPMQRLWELDVDKSGGVSMEEFKAGRLHQKLPMEKQEALFKRLDSDGDGAITPKDKPKPPFNKRAGRKHGGCQPNKSEPDANMNQKPSTEDL